MEPTVTEEPGKAEELKELVQGFRVCWKAWPELAYVGDEKRQIGHALELAGTHEPSVQHPDPGCEHCRRVFRALQEIAEWILPREERPSEYEIEPYRPAITHWSLHHNRPDVMLTIRIPHRHGYELPLDGCEDRCLKEMEQRLAAMGACRLQWTGHKGKLEQGTDDGRPARPARPARR